MQSCTAQKIKGIARCIQIIIEYAILSIDHRGKIKQLIAKGYAVLGIEKKKENGDENELSR